MVAPRPVRSQLLARVHVAKKQLGLDDAAYRAVVLRVTGCDSAGQVSNIALQALLAEFERLGWRPRHARPLSVKPHVRKVHALWGALRPHLTRTGEAQSDAALRAFVRRQTGVGSPEWLDGPQANKVIEGLKAWLARLEASQAKEAGPCPAA